jgi:hypothetical protein
MDQILMTKKIGNTQLHANNAAQKSPRLPEQHDQGQEQKAA